MACPRCLCKTTYPYEDGENQETCPNCGHIFDVEDAVEEEDDYSDFDDDLPF